MLYALITVSVLLAIALVVIGFLWRAMSNDVKEQVALHREAEVLLMRHGYEQAIEAVYARVVKHEKAKLYERRMNHNHQAAQNERDELRWRRVAASLGELENERRELTTARALADAEYERFDGVGER